MERAKLKMKPLLQWRLREIWKLLHRRHNITKKKFKIKSKIYFSGFAIFWALIISGSLLWNIYTLDNNRFQIVQSIGQSFFKEIETTRLWNARHGGVYVPITEKTQPNSFLKVSNRDITSSQGLKLTLVNPAYMTRQIAEIAYIESNIQYHITSLKPIRPQNKADDWEIKALTLFEKGSSEFTEYVEDKMVYRYMAPLFVKKACLKCHDEQGYKVGDIRGGISVTLPAKTYINASIKSKNMLIIIHLFFLIVGLVALYLFGRFRDRQLVILDKKNTELEYEVAKRVQAEEELRESHVEMEKKVIERTSDLIKAKDEAQQANNLKSEFLANISHELRTPLHHILNYSKFGVQKMDGVNNGKLLHYFSQINVTGKRLLALINDLLDLSRLEAGMLNFEMKSKCIKNTIKNVVEEFTVETKKKKLSIHIKNTTLSTQIKYDEFNISQVVRNLLSNAIKFTPPEKKIDILFSSNSFSSLTISVKDDGIGIPKDELEFIFDRFVQSSKTKTGAGGTGLGLSICLKIINAHKGKIWAENNQHGGATFSFMLPYKQDSISL